MGGHVGVAASSNASLPGTVKASSVCTTSGVEYRDGKGDVRCGDALRSPMMDGSWWCSCGMVLKRWVMSFAPFLTAVVAISVLVVLCAIVHQASAPRNVFCLVVKPYPQPVSDRDNHPSSAQFLHGTHDAFHLWCDSEYPDIYLALFCTARVPIFGVGQVGRSVDFLKRRKPSACREEKGRHVCPALGVAQEGAFYVPAQEARRGRGGKWAQK